MSDLSAKIKKKKVGRPKAEVDLVVLEELAGLHCTYEEMARCLKVSVDTLERNFAEIIDKGREEGKRKLRHALWESALRGNLGAQIWLSKQHLGMTDKIDTKLDANIKNTEKEVIVYEAQWGNKGEPIADQGSQDEDD